MLSRYRCVARPNVAYPGMHPEGFKLHDPYSCRVVHPQQAVRNPQQIEVHDQNAWVDNWFGLLLVSLCQGPIFYPTIVGATLLKVGRALLISFL